MTLIDQMNISSLVDLDTTYKTVEEIHTELSDVDILVLPYSQTEESASGVLAMLLAVGKPIIATDLDIFTGARNSIISIEAPAQATELASSLAELAKQPDRMLKMGARARQRALEISWGAIGQQTAELYQSLLSQ